MAMNLRKYPMEHVRVLGKNAFDFSVKVLNSSFNVTLVTRWLRPLTMGQNESSTSSISSIDSSFLGELYVRFCLVMSDADLDFDID